MSSELNTESHSYEQNIQVVILEKSIILVRVLFKSKNKNIYLGLDRNNPSEYLICEIQSQDQANSFKTDLKLNEKLEELRITPRTLLKGEYHHRYSLYQYRITEKNGPSLKLCFLACNRAFQIQTICQIAIQGLIILEKLHKAQILHCNLKPKKIITQSWGVELMLIDFKSAMKYKNKAPTQKQKQQRQIFLNKYSSLNTHMGISIRIFILGPTPKDDLESFAYILFNFFIGGKIFKQKESKQAQKSRQERLKDIEIIKMNLVIEKYITNLPMEMIQFYYAIKMASNTEFHKIDYENYRRYFRKILLDEKMNEANLGNFPWQQKPQKQQPKVVINDRINEEDESSESCDLNEPRSDLRLDEYENLVETDDLSTVEDQMDNLRNKTKFKQVLDLYQSR